MIWSGNPPSGCFTPDSEGWADIPGRQLRARSGREQMQQVAPLLDHLVGAREERLRHSEAERPCGLEVDEEIVVGCSTGRSPASSPSEFCPRRLRIGETSPRRSGLTSPISVASACAASGPARRSPLTGQGRSTADATRCTYSRRCSSTSWSSCCGAPSLPPSMPTHCRWRSAPLASPEHCEEALIEAAIARGEAVHRSRTASPAAVLGVRVVAANDTRAADTRAATATKGEPRRVVPPHPHGIVSTSCCPIAGATLAGTRFCTTRRA